MMRLTRKLVQGLRYRLVAGPAGFGRPLPKTVLDGEYSSGAWSHFHDKRELSRQLLVAGLCAEFYPRGTVLDLGCGSGRLAQLMQPFGFRRYLGIDLSTEALQRARKLNLTACEFVEADFEQWRPAERFDAIIFTECIGYTRDPGALTAAFAPFLSPGGRAIISLFRFRHSAAQWRRVERHYDVVHATVVSNEARQTWDIKILQPKAVT